MRGMACCMAAMLVFGAPACAAGVASAVLPGLQTSAASAPAAPQQEAAGESGLKCYMPYAASGDHVAAGCEIPGYRMNFGLARQWGMFMVLLPEDAGIEDARVYFSLDTPAFDGHPLQELFEADLKGLQASRPGTRIVKRLTHTLPIKGSGKCEGVSVAYPPENSHFPYETYFICDAGSKRYALMLSLSAMSQQDMDAAMPAFLKWMDVPQTVRDAQARKSP